MKKLFTSIVVACSVLISGCGSGGQASQLPSTPLRQDLRTFRRHGSAQSPITNVVIIVQENRTVDNLFQFLPGANTQSYGLNAHGKKVALQSEPLNGPVDPSHSHAAFVTEYDHGQMNGWTPGHMAYVPQRQVQPYYTLAENYAFADDFFQGNQGPSFPGHQYLVSGTSTVSDGSPDEAAENAVAPGGSKTGGCDSAAGTLVKVIDPQGHEPSQLSMFPCFQRQSLMNELDAAGVSWKYYQDSPGAGIWHGPDAIYSIWSNPGEMATHVSSPPTQVLTDIEDGRLANVVWVTPETWYSDHPGNNEGAGPSWISAIVNAIGSSPYWNSTAIFITWDDWGGWYDHVSPPIYNSYELGFRVPLIVVSPYAKAGYISHTQHEFGSILKFVEEQFGLPSLGTTDSRADDLSDCFNFDQSRKRLFRVIPAPHSRRYFFQHRGRPGTPED